MGLKNGGTVESTGVISLDHKTFSSFENAADLYFLYCKYLRTRNINLLKNMQLKTAIYKVLENCSFNSIGT